MKHLKFILFIFIVFALQACLKDKVKPVEPVATEECSDCIPLPPITGYSTGYYYDYPPVYQLFVQFNPNNDDEILFLEKGFNLAPKIFKLNMVTNQEDLIYAGVQIFNPKWGKQDWIIFSEIGDQIWKIKSNGDSLSVVTSNGSWFHPEWNQTGDRFISYRGLVDVNDYYNGAIWDTYGNIIDTFDWNPIRGDWNHPNYYAGISGNDLSIIDPYSNQIISTSSTNDNYSLYESFNWISENEGLYTTGEGIFHINVWTKEVTKLKCACSSIRYTGGTVNVDGSKIIYERTTYTPFGNTGLKVLPEFVIMNTDGTNETVINIP